MAKPNGHDTTCGAADPLLAALIAKLPPSGGEWPLERQASWLRMMAMAFGEVYTGGDGLAELLDIPAFIKPREGAPAGAAAVPLDPRTAANGGPFVRVRANPERFYIAKDGRALKDPGAVPIDVTEASHAEMIEDTRPAGAQDLEDIVWKDGKWPPGSLPSLNIVQAQG